jgi:FAD/FMN-containing dehydrogenase
MFSWHAGLGDGRLRVMQGLGVNAQNEIAMLKEMRRSVEENGGSFSIESAPEGIRREVMTRSGDEMNASLMRRVKQQLDPHSLFCPKLFG